MKWLSDFLKLRKRHDSIKFALILFLCAAYFIVNGIIQIASYASYLNKPVEYILEAASASATLDIGLDKLKETEGAVSASFQHDYVAVFENDAVLVVSELSSEYLSECYGIESAGSGKKIWMNSVAYNEFVGETDETSVRLSYSVDDKKESAEFIKCVALDSEVVFAVSVGTSASLGGSNIVRVMFDGIDVSGSNIKHLENVGYSISNKEDMLSEVYKQELFFVEVKYDIITAILSFIGGYVYIQVYKLKRKWF